MMMPQLIAALASGMAMAEVSERNLTSASPNPCPSGNSKDNFHLRFKPPSIFQPLDDSYLLSCKVQMLLPRL